MSEVPHPIPFRTRSLSPPEPMVLRLKARESRSPPALPVTYLDQPHSSLQSTAFDAGWSSPVARQAHNLKVVGSNPTPAPKGPPSLTGPTVLRATLSHNTPRPALTLGAFSRLGLCNSLRLVAIGTHIPSKKPR